ncbi:MAG: MFS transporter [Oscillospiraceae bacterium]|nr:MFS transporter [Oscillospiraceae bacterium]
MEQTIRTRRVKLIVAFTVMLFAGIIYAWSITNTPFAKVSNGDVLNATQLGLNYTLTIVFFCIGGFAAGLISKHTTSSLRFVLSAAMLFTSFMASSLQIVTLEYSGNYFMLYMAYGVLGGLGIGVAYVTIISTINMWYPDKRGFSSGVTLMGFGFSLLIVGRIVDLLGNSESIGWRTTYVIIAITLGIVLLVAAVMIRPPPKNTVFPESKSDNKHRAEAVVQDYTALEMIKRPSFILAFVYITILASTGSAAISFAKEIMLDVNSSNGLAVTAVGMLGVSNGLGRLALGWLFDKRGLWKTRLISSAVAILAPLTIVFALMANSVVLGVIGLCLCGFTYGFAPTTSSVFASEYYGQKNFPLNFSILTLILIPAPFAAMMAGGIKSSTGGFLNAFLILTALTIIGFFVNLAIRKP